MFDTPAEMLELADWRRRVFGLYRDVRRLQQTRPDEAFDLWCSGRNTLFLDHPQSPIPLSERASFKGLSYFDYDPDARVTATVEPAEPGTWSFDASEGTLTLDCVAKAGFSLYGKQQSLNLYWFRSYGGGLFLSFRDGTSGKTTYGGCRYLLDTVKGADLGTTPDGLLLDFNFSYQPSCAYDPRWVCPLAPPSNRLEVEIRAGERYVTAAAHE